MYGKKTFVGDFFLNDIQSFNSDFRAIFDKTNRGIYQLNCLKMWKL